MKTKSKEYVNFQASHLFLMFWCGLQCGITAELSLTPYPIPLGKQFAMILGSGEGRGLCLNATSPILRLLFNAQFLLAVFLRQKYL